MREVVRKRKVRTELLALLDMTPFQRAAMFEREMVLERLTYRNAVPMEVRCR